MFKDRAVSGRVKRKKEQWTGYAFVMPGFVGILAFIVLPYLDVIRRAFTQTATGNFVGMKNFADVFQNQAFRLAMGNTVHFIGVCIPILVFLSLGIAVLLAKNSRFSKAVRTGILVPMAVPIASIVLLWQFLFDRNGFLNGCLHLIGIEGADWMHTSYAFSILVFSYVWKNLGYTVILWLAGISMIPSDIYEAARVDGAGEWQCFWKITIPNLKGTFFTVAVISLINSFKVFREAYLVSGDYPNSSIYLLQHLFNNWFRNLELDKMAAGSVMLSFVLILLIMGLWGGKRE